MRIDEAELISVLAQGGLQRGVSHHWGFREVSGCAVFLKACADERRLPRLLNEWLWLSRVFPLAPDLVPQPVAILRDLPGFCALLVTAVVEGDSAAELLGTHAAHRLGKALRALHSLPCPSAEIQLDGRSWQEWPAFVRESMLDYVEAIRAHGGALDEAMARELRAAAEVFAERSRPISMGIIHGDPTFLNLIVRGESACLVDFELAQVGDPLFDLATADLLSIRGDARLWSALAEGYGLTCDDGLTYRLWFYQLLRQVRLARGKLWIHGQQDAFQRELGGVSALLARRAEVEAAGK